MAIEPKPKAKKAKPEQDSLTPKQEAFALAYFETGNAAEAYRRSYDVEPNARDEWLYVEASQLLDHPKIALRLKALSDQAAKLSVYTRHRAMEELEEARGVAKAQGQAAAMVGATSAKIKLTGLDRPQRIEHTGADGGPIQTEEVSARERINRRISSIATRSAAAGDTGEPE